MLVGLQAPFAALVALLAVFPSFVSAQNTSTVAASTFFITETETQFSVNVANDSSDVYLYFTSPAYSWVGVGFGSKMENSLMFIMYPNADGDNVTISTRYGSKASEPSFSSDPELEVLPGTTINDSMLILHARCRNCRVWPSGVLDTSSSAHPMIYAFGHGNRLYSNSPSAGLKRHIRYGHFTMDLLAATGTGGVPAKSSALAGVKMIGSMTRDHDRKNLAHAIVGCLALFVLWPLNVIFAGFFKNIKIHIIVSVGILAFLITAYGLGIATSSQFNRSKNYNTGHQITAFISLLPILLLSILPLPSLASLHAKIPRLHTPLSSLSFVLLTITGGLGLNLASQARPILLAYAAVALLVFFFNIVLQSCIRRRGSAHARAANRRRLGEDESSSFTDRIFKLAKMDDSSHAKSSQHSDSRSTSQASLRGAPPAYTTQPYAAATPNESREFGADGQQGYPATFSQQYAQPQRSPRGANGIYGGGTMPGPQYLLNMHPGVPVQVSRM